MGVEIVGYTVENVVTSGSRLKTNAKKVFILEYLIFEFDLADEAQQLSTVCHISSLVELNGKIEWR